MSSRDELPKLYYFKARGRAVFIRPLLVFLEIKYDNHILTEDEFVKIRNDNKLLPNGQVPLWVDHDIQLVQSNAISRYIANKKNFSGITLIEKAKADEIIDSLWDCINSIWNNQNEKDKKDQLLEKGIIVKILTNLESRLGDDDDHKFKEFSVTNYADLFTAIAFDYICWKGLEYIGGDVSKYPKLQKLMNHFLNIPRLKEFYSNLPVTIN